MTSRDDVQKSYLSGRWRDIMTTCFVAFLSKINLYLKKNNYSDLDNHCYPYI